MATMATIFDRAIARISSLESEVKELTDTNRQLELENKSVTDANFRLQSDNSGYAEKINKLESSCVELDRILKAGETPDPNKPQAVSSL